MLRRPRSEVEFTARSSTGVGWMTPPITRLTCPEAFSSTRKSVGPRKTIPIGCANAGAENRRDLEIRVQNRHRNGIRTGEHGGHHAGRQCGHPRRHRHGELRNVRRPCSAGANVCSVAHIPPLLSPLNSPHRGSEKRSQTDAVDLSVLFSCYAPLVTGQGSSRGEMAACGSNRSPRGMEWCDPDLILTHGTAYMTDSSWTRRAGLGSGIPSIGGSAQRCPDAGSTNPTPRDRHPNMPPV